MSARASALLIAALGLCACEREERRFHDDPAAPAASRYMGNAWAMSEGKRLYNWFNCVGCHSHGGGGMGPPLMDAKWIYGSDPTSIYTSIAEGRVNGMPAFRGKIPDHQIWQLVAYVRSMSGLAPTSAAPGRADSIQLRPAEATMKEQKPRIEGEAAR